eukprot:6633883-Pyramimonas_sp.AAC.1
MGFGRAYMFFAYVLWPITFLSGMFAPVLVWFPWLYENDFPEQVEVGIWTAFSVFTWSIGMLFIGPSMVEEVGTVAV